MKIGDFSKLTKVSVRMLRYYDKEDVLKPQKIDNENGHRSYSITQVPTLQKVIMLRDLNFGINEIKEIITHWDKETLLNHMKERLQTTYQIIDEEQDRALKIQQAMEHIQKNETDRHYSVVIKSIPELLVLSLRRKMHHHFEEEILWNELYHFIQEKRLSIDQTRYNNIAIYHDSKDDSVDIEVAYIVKKKGINSASINYRTLDEVTLMASMMVYGSYQHIDEAYRSFVDWLSNHSEYSIGDTSRQITIIDHRHTNNEEDFLTEIQIPLVVTK
ncbi:MerR family transcriptional regulator [Enterococcus sp. AZ196]|uniref:MerR family transcriptional regulator n=1 Tax=Enterococcus sp. AZ196 TaxID=2774659 RepID=UPI003D26A3DD